MHSGSRLSVSSKSGFDWHSLSLKKLDDFFSSFLEGVFSLQLNKEGFALLCFCREKKDPLVK